MPAGGIVYGWLAVIRMLMCWFCFRSMEDILVVALMKEQNVRAGVPSLRVSMGKFSAKSSQLGYAMSWPKTHNTNMLHMRAESTKIKVCWQHVILRHG